MACNCMVLLVLVRGTEPRTIQFCPQCGVGTGVMFRRSHSVGEWSVCICSSVICPYVTSLARCTRGPFPWASREGIVLCIVFNQPGVSVGLCFGGPWCVGRYGPAVAMMYMSVHPLIVASRCSRLICVRIWELLFGCGGCWWISAVAVSFRFGSSFRSVCHLSVRKGSFHRCPRKYHSAVWCCVVRAW